jgi:hypothetical protein
MGWKCSWDGRPGKQKDKTLIEECVERDSVEDEDGVGV